MWSSLHIGKLLLCMFVTAGAIVQSSPTGPGTRGTSGKPSLGIVDSGTPGVSKRQATAEQLHQFARAFSNLGGAPTVTEPGDLGGKASETSSGLVRKETIPASFFYDEKGLFVRCNQPAYVYNLRPWDHPDFPEFKIEDWPDYSKFESRQKALLWIRDTQYGCKRCRCDEEGRIIRNPKGTPNCGPKTVKKCSLFYACFCTVNLIQPVATSTTATVTDYQNALDSIPVSARAQNTGYHWRWGGSTLRFTDPRPPLRFADDTLAILPAPQDSETLGLETSSYGGLARVLDPSNGYFAPSKGNIAKWQ
ncbi:hypothetical protein TWF481_004885 [Arthrobotrys musiformis]|uniref:Uncharacterized protein n=1 Tax=Arthrobotrys musiformis TaxID=47236 RepID=A0AAV9WMG9_9PEZI